MLIKRASLFLILILAELLVIPAQLQGEQRNSTIDSIPQLTTQIHLPALTASFTNSKLSTNALDILNVNFPPDVLQSVAHSAQQFGLEFLVQMSDLAGNANKDFMISPFSIWSLLILLLEGAAGDTYKQLRKALRINIDEQTLRCIYSLWATDLNINTSTIEVASLNALFTDKLHPIISAYEEVIKSYAAKRVSVDFADPNTYEYINNEASKATRGLIPYTVRAKDIKDAKLFMLSSLFFKGQWKFPFNKTLTRIEPFYDETGTIVANVSMMVQENKFVYTGTVNGLDGYVLELPYGKLDRLSMLIILPKRGFSLQHVVKNLQRLGIEPILNNLATSPSAYDEDNIEVFMPKFRTTTDITLNKILYQMGIVDMFDESIANLSRMTNDMFVQLCVHSTKIIVDEEGTKAAAATSAVIIKKASPPKFLLNKPFQYLIVDKPTKLTLFAGQVRSFN